MGNIKVVLKVERAYYKNILTPIKAKKTPKKKKKYVVIDNKLVRKKVNVVHHMKLALKKEHYVEALKYYEIMELLSDAQYLKTVMNDESGFPKLIKKFLIKNDNISPRSLNLSYILFVGKYVIYIVLHTCAHVDEPGLFFMACVTASLWYVLLDSCYLVFMLKLG